MVKDVLAGLERAGDRRPEAGRQLDVHDDDLKISSKRFTHSASPRFQKSLISNNSKNRSLRTVLLTTIHKP
jgi:hypothetical protein